MAGQSFDVESLRHPHESNSEWRKRRPFLEQHHDKFDLDRLVCLSNCYINIVVYGCKYPGPVMQQIQTLSSDLPEDVKQKGLGIGVSKKIDFVKSSKASDSESENEESETGKKTQCIYGMKFVQAGSDYKSTDSLSGSGSKPDVPPPLMRMTPTPGFRQRAGLGSSAARAARPLKIPKKVELNVKFKDLAKQMLVVYNKDNNINAIQLVDTAASMCKIRPTSNFDTLPTDSGTPFFICTTSIDGVDCGKGRGLSKKAAKHEAYQSIVEKLSFPVFGVFEVSRKNYVLSNTPVVEYIAGPGEEEEPEEMDIEEEEGEKEPAEAPKEAKEPKKSSEEKGFENLPAYERFNRIVQQKAAKEKQLPEIDSRTQGQKRSYDDAFWDLTQFIILDRTLCNPNINEIAMLQMSGDFNKVPVSYEYDFDLEGHRCSLFINRVWLADAIHEEKSESKVLVARKGMEKLRRICWTIRIKQEVDADEDQMSKEELLGDIKQGKVAIPDSNIGNMLLRKMGWVGGGVGKDGSGIAEPVSVNQVINRQGLGLDTEQGIGKGFVEKVKALVMDYAKSDNESDLAFTSEFTKEERAIIHKEGQKLGLKTQSKGKGDDRFLIMSRKRTASQLLKHVVMSGGSTSKYEVLPPPRDEEDMEEEDLG